MEIKVCLALCVFALVAVTVSQVNCALNDPGTSNIHLKEDTPCLCTADWKPVCGSDKNVYSNSCATRCKGILIYCDCPECSAGGTCSCPLTSRI